MTTFVDKVLLVDDALTAGGVEHAFGGAIALAYGVLAPRATDDIDVNISASADRAREVLACLPAAVDWDIADVAAVARDGQVRVRFREDRTPLDLFFPQHAFHEAVAGAATGRPFAGRLLPVISPTHLAVFKVLFNRPKDWVDIEAMLVAGTVDTAEARNWLAGLLGTGDPLFRRFEDLAASAPSEQDDMGAPLVDWRHLGS
ncbi:hypothetical protein K6U06_23645 [Acidiferrimicrobium sp. IK]|uniref:hypothetical protein n=1 Tax=Acidiferrimicrobium sp. IK TaxID=2871700 RepID=UPI0021CAECFF|nr:hypothetical protein [Acidiferrimicrobium sp. IK]MCU4187374.1 hypothetical protein [Acidiferrimicrobium sp. IK]